MSRGDRQQVLSAIALMVMSIAAAGPIVLGAPPWVEVITIMMLAGVMALYFKINQVLVELQDGALSSEGRERS